MNINSISLNEQIKDFLSLHLTIVEETVRDYICYCPFHDNRDTPALSVSKKNGLWYCFNPACGSKGNINSLSMKLTGKPLGVIGGRQFSEDDILSMLQSNEEEIDDYELIMEKITINYEDPVDLAKLNYLLDRGFHASILKQFEVCYSEKQKRIVLPVRGDRYNLLGFIGRAIDEETKPKYKYSTGLPKSGILFNLHNAKRFSQVIVTEGSLDAIKVHQAGFPYVVSTLGAQVTDNQVKLLNKYFNEIIVFSDNDEAGNKMRSGIIERCSRKNLWVVEYPDGIKDPGEMAVEQIQNTIQNKVNYIDYLFKEKL